MDTSSKDNYLLNSVRISSNLVLERGSAELMQNNLDYKHIRSNVVKGILAVLIYDNDEIRDSSVQIFDRYIYSLTEENGLNHLATLPNDYYKYITAACIQLSLKLYNTNYHKIKSCNDNNNNNNNYDNSSTVTDENNSNYNYDNHNSNTNNHRDGMYLVDLLNLDATELRYYERMVMFRTAMFISPLCTPIAFARLFIDCDKENFDGMHGHLLHVLGVVIGDFWNDTRSVLFAPSTVALSAMILVCSVYNIQCEKWLDNIPNYCFINNQAHEFFVNEQEKYLDIHACIAVIEKCEVYHKLVLKKKAMSPTSVTNTK